MSAPKKTKNTVQNKAAAQEPAAIDWSQYAGETGFENISQSDLGIPFLSIIQPKGAEIDRTHKNYATKKIEGAGAGDIINTVSRQIIMPYDKGSIEVVPAAYEKTWIEWQQNRGGLVKIHRNEGVTKDVVGKTEKNEDMLRNGNLLVETACFYVYLLQDMDEPLPCVINMFSTGLKHARHWLNLMSGLRIGQTRVQPPMFSHTYKLNAAIESNAKGSWYGWNIVIGHVVNDRNLVNMCLQTTKKVSLLVQQAKGGALPAPTPEGEEVPM